MQQGVVLMQDGCCAADRRLLEETHLTVCCFQQLIFSTEAGQQGFVRQSSSQIHDAGCCYRIIRLRRRDIMKTSTAGLL